jgi:hypothetical protein
MFRNFMNILARSLPGRKFESNLIFESVSIFKKRSNDFERQPLPKMMIF